MALFGVHSSNKPYTSHGDMEYDDTKTPIYGTKQYKIGVKRNKMQR